MTNPLALVILNQYSMCLQNLPGKGNWIHGWHTDDDWPRVGFYSSCLCSICNCLQILPLTAPKQNSRGKTRGLYHFMDGWEITDRLVLHLLFKQWEGLDCPREEQNQENKKFLPFLWRKKKYTRCEQGVTYISQKWAQCCIPSGLKLEINSRRKTGKFTNVWKLKTFLTKGSKKKSQGT